MKKLWSFAFVCAAAIYAQTAPSAPQKQLDTNKPVCSPGAICFSGEVFAGNEFRKRSSTFYGSPTLDHIQQASGQ